MNATILSRCWMSQGYFRREYRRSVGAMLALVLSRYLIQQGCVYISGRKTTSSSLSTMYHIVLWIFPGIWQNQDLIVIEFG